MCCASSLYAQILGLFFFLTGLTMLMHTARWKKTFSEIVASHALLAITGVVSTLVGLIVVVTHNLWVSDERVLITLLGWFMLIQGLLRMFYPDAFVEIAKNLAEKGVARLLNWVLFLIGAYLVWTSFFQQQ